MIHKKLLPRLISIIVALLLFSACGDPQVAPTSTIEPAQQTPTQIPPKPTTSIPPTPDETATPTIKESSSTLPQLHVVGNKIVNENGEVVVLKGYGINDPINLDDGRFTDDPNWNEALFRELRDWGTTIVRLPVHPPNFKKNESRALKVLDQAIEWAEKNGMYVIIDYHAFGFPPREFLVNTCYETCTAATMTDTIHFWQVVSERYAGNNTVAFYEIFNEPGSHPWTAGLVEKKEDWIIWKDFNELVIDMIRENDPDKVVLVAGLSFAKDQSFIMDAPVERNNVAYAIHHNPLTNWKFGEIADRYPVFATEVSFTLGLTGGESYSNESNHIGSQQYRYDLTDLMVEKDIGWTVAAFAPSWGGFTMIVDKSYEPTETGLFWKEYIQNFDHKMTTSEKISDNKEVFSEAVGTWTSRDPDDGRLISLTIFNKSDNTFSIRYEDEVVPLCGVTKTGQPRSGGLAIGTGEPFYNKLAVGPLNMECQDGSDYVGGLYFNSFVYDPEADTITDIWGNQWTRSE